MPVQKAWSNDWECAVAQALTEFPLLCRQCCLLEGTGHSKVNTCVQLMHRVCCSCTTTHAEQLQHECNYFKKEITKNWPNQDEKYLEVFWSPCSALATGRLLLFLLLLLRWIFTRCRVFATLWRLWIIGRTRQLFNVIKMALTKVT